MMNMMDALDAMPAGPARVAAVHALHDAAFKGVVNNHPNSSTLPAWMKMLPSTKCLSSLPGYGNVADEVFVDLNVVLRRLVRRETGLWLSGMCVNSAAAVVGDPGSHWWGMFMIATDSGGPVPTSAGNTSTSFYYDSMDNVNPPVKSPPPLLKGMNFFSQEMKRSGITSFAPRLEPLAKRFPNVGLIHQVGWECGVLLVMALRVVADSLLRGSGYAGALRAADELQRVLPLPKFVANKKVTQAQATEFRRHMSVWYLRHIMYASTSVRAGPAALAHAYCYRADRNASLEEFIERRD
jgi:hypothetical protein